jgi:hypothetical protein
VGINAKLNKYLKVKGIIYNMFKTENVKDKKIKLYNTLSLPAVLYGSEIWTIK